MNWFYLALLAPFLYAIVNLLDDNLLRYVYKSPSLATAFTGIFGVLPATLVLFRPVDIAAHLAVLAALAGFLTVTYYYFYFKGLESDSPSVVMALFSLAPATLPIFAYLFVHEQLQWTQGIGFVVVLLASFAMAATDIRKFKFSKALVPVVIAVIFIDIVSLLSKHVYLYADFFSAYVFFCLGMGLGGLMFLAITFNSHSGWKDIKGKVWKLLPFLILTELINVAAEFTINLAISEGPVSLVRVIEGIQPMFVLLIALALYPLAPRFFREAEEGRKVQKLILMAVAALGLGIIALA